VVTDGWGGYDPLPKQVTGTNRTRRATLEGRPRFCRASIVSLGTSRPGFVAPITASATLIFKPTWTSSFSVQSPANTDGAFQTLLGLGSQQQPTTYKQLYRVELNG